MFDVVKYFLDLSFHQATLFLNNNDLVEAFSKLTNSSRLQWPRHCHFENSETKALRLGFINTEVLQRLPHIEIGFATGHNTQPRTGAAHHPLVQLVGARERHHRRNLVIVKSRFLLQRLVRETPVQAALRHGEVGRHDNAHPLRADIDGRTCIDRVFHALQPDPATRKPG